MRLIDADKLLEGTTELKQSPWLMYVYSSPDINKGIKIVEDLIKEAPTVEVATDTNAPINDTISRQEAIDAIMDESIHEGRPSVYAQKILSLPSAQPTIDAVSKEEYDKLKDLCEQYKYERDVLEDVQRNKVEVVRCKDCKWWESLEKGHPVGYCNACKHGYKSSSWDIGIYRTTRKDFFCADGERKEE